MHLDLYMAKALRNPVLYYNIVLPGFARHGLSVGLIVVQLCNQFPSTTRRDHIAFDMQKNTPYKEKTKTTRL